MHTRACTFEFALHTFTARECHNHYLRLRAASPAATTVALTRTTTLGFLCARCNFPHRIHHDDPYPALPYSKKLAASLR